MKVNAARITIVLVLLSFVSLLILPSPAHALDYYWIGDSGSWDDPSNWDPYGLPQVHVDNAFLTSSDSIDRTVYHNEDIVSGFYKLHIDSIGTGTMTLEVSQGNLSGMQAYVGDGGSGTLLQTGGKVFLGDWLDIGSEGTYELAGGLIQSFGADRMRGTFNQTGGDYWTLDGLWLIGESGSIAEYNLSGGTLNLDSIGAGLRINEFGVFSQSGGEVTPESRLGVDGVYNLKDGVLNPGHMVVGGTFNQTGGVCSASGELGENGLFIDSSTGSQGIYNLSGGILEIKHIPRPAANAILNNGTFNYSGGELLLNLDGEGANPFVNNGTVNLSGSGTRVIDGSVVNNGTFKTTHTTAVYNGTFTNNGAYISDPASQYFIDLIVAEAGYLVGQHNDKFYISGDFINHSLMSDEWNTKQAYLGFVEGEDSLHDFYLTGFDYGATMSGYANNFAWGTLDVTDNYLSFYDGNSEEGAALYLRELWGLAIDEDLIANLYGFEGLSLYYMPHLKENRYLAGLTYNLSGGGYLRPSVPEPSTMLLLSSGLIGLAGFRRKFRK